MKKIFVHCGLSKFGSSALQAQISKRRYLLSDNKVSALICAGKQHELYPEKDEEIKFDLKNMIDAEGHHSISLGPLFRLYVSARVNRNIKQLQEIENSVLSEIEASVKTADAVIISAEAFEISLAICDKFFLRIIKKIEKLAEVSLIVYRPNLSKHVISSWCEFAWRENLKFSDWLVQSVLSERQYFAKTGSAYLPKLYSNEWAEFWSSRGVKLLLHENVENVASHFFEKIVGIKEFHLAKLDLIESNIGWPKKLIKYYPHLMHEIATDEDFASIKKLLYLIVSELKGSNAYNELYDLIEDCYIRPGVTTTEEQLRKIDQIFEISESDKNELFLIREKLLKSKLF